MTQFPITDFDSYLRKQHIDAQRFRQQDPLAYHALNCVFEQVHENSFTQQKLFIINNIRRTYLLNTTT